jgi:hypothetical protein
MLDLFLLAHKQIMKEIDSGIRPLKAIKINEKIYPYSYNDLLLYAIRIRKWIDKHNKNGASIESMVSRTLTGNKEYRRNYYLRKGK